jgi:hypothetical protein
LVANLNRRRFAPYRKRDEKSQRRDDQPGNLPIISCVIVQAEDETSVQENWHTRCNRVFAVTAIAGSLCDETRSDGSINQHLTFTLLWKRPN